MTEAVNNNYRVSSGAINQENMQKTVAKSQEAVVDSFESNSVIQSGLTGVTEGDNRRETLLLLPVIYQLNGFIDSLIGKSGNSGLLQKAANLGDKISHTFNLDKLISAENEGRFASKIKENRLTKYFTNTFAAVPKSSFAKSQPMKAEYGAKLDEQAQKILSEIPSRVYGDGASVSAVKSNLSEGTRQLLKDVCPNLTTDYLSKVSSSVSELSAKAVSEADKKALETLQTSIKEYLENSEKQNAEKLFGEISSTLSRFKGSEAAKDLTSETSKLLSGINKGHTTEQILNAVDDLAANGINIKGQSKLSIIRNKYKAACSQMGDTLLGKTFSKGFLKSKDIITYGGDLISLGFTASALIQAGKAAKEAPKGEKKSTFMHVLSENYIGFILLKPSTKLVYSAAGNKYRGMNEAGRAALKDLVKSANANPNLTKEGLKIANLQKKLLLKGVDASKVSELANMGLDEAKAKAAELMKQGSKTKLWEKPLKAAGKILSTGLDDIKIHKKVKLPLLGEKLISRPTLKGFMGGLGRALLVMMVVQPFIQKPITKLIHKIFGEPKTYLEKQKQKEEAAADNNKTTAIDGGQDSNQENSPDTNLINKYIKTSTGEQPMNVQPENIQPEDIQPTNVQPEDVQPEDIQPLPSAQIQNETPAAATGISDKILKKNDRYIPSIKVGDNSAAREKELEKNAEDILKRDEALIKQVRKTLGK